MPKAPKRQQAEGNPHNHAADRTVCIGAVQRRKFVLCCRPLLSEGAIFWVENELGRGIGMQIHYRHSRLQQFLKRERAAGWEGRQGLKEPITPLCKRDRMLIWVGTENSENDQGGQPCMLEWDRLVIVPLLQGVIGPEKGALGEERFLFKKNSLLHTSQCQRRGKAFIFVANVSANSLLPVGRRV